MNCQFWLHCFIQLKEKPPYLMSQPYLIFRYKWDIKHYLFFLTSATTVKLGYKPHCQQCLLKFTHACHVILQLILSKLSSKNCSDLSNSINWQFFHYKLSNPINHQFWHLSCIRLKDLLLNLVSHPNLIFTNKCRYSTSSIFLSFSYHGDILYKPHCQQCWVMFPAC